METRICKVPCREQQEAVGVSSLSNRDTIEMSLVNLT